MTTQNVEALREQAAEIRDKIYRIEAVARFEQSTKLIGKCFKYRNCYSCPKPDEYWWMYSRITGCTKNGDLVVFSFQVDQYGDFSCEPNKHKSSGLSFGEPITLKQFQHAWKITARMLNDRATAAKAYQP